MCLNEKLNKVLIMVAKLFDQKLEPYIYHIHRIKGNQKMKYDSFKIVRKNK